ncbi:ABC transporter permease [Paraburkholderia sp. J41]|uniref:ABC transporter permease n=1 Tax=Paraburkholderia sp. J41 TaxID=2805433 RepID=UPI002AC35570|nr:ABC transporter permease [Paraburkholderia sp. J41]
MIANTLVVQTGRAARTGCSPRVRSVTALAILLPVALCLLLFGIALAGLLIDGFHAPASGSAQPSAAWTFANFSRVFGDPLYRDTMTSTLRLSVLTTAASLVLGLPISFWMNRGESRRVRSVLIMLVAVPFLTSLVVRLYALMLLLGNAGLINQLLRAGGIVAPGSFFPLIRNPLSVLIGLTYFVLPFVIFTLSGSFRRHDRTLAEAAQTLGADEWMTLWHVQLPLLMPGIAAAGTLAFVLASTAFATPLILGGSAVRMLGNAIYDEAMVSQNMATAASLSLIALVLTVGCLALVALLGRRRRAHG